MNRHLRASVESVRTCDYRDPKGVRRENLRQPGGGQAPLEHALEGVRREGLTGEGTISLLAGAKQPRVLGPANRPFVQVTVHGDLPDPSSFFRKLQRPVAVIPQILDLESEDSPGPGARIDECPQYCPVELFEEEVETASGVRPERQSVVAFIKEQGTERIASSPVTRAQSRPLKPVQSDPDRAKNDPSHFYEIDGKMVICRTAKEVLVMVFEEFAKRDPTFCESFAKRMPGRTRKYLARSKKDLYPGHPEFLEYDAVELPGGWWIGTHSSNRQKRRWITVACELAGFKLRRNFDFRVP